MHLNVCVSSHPEPAPPLVDNSSVLYNFLSGKNRRTHLPRYLGFAQLGVMETQLLSVYGLTWTQRHDECVCVCVCEGAIGILC